MKIQVYDYYQLMTDEKGKFTKEQKKILRKGAKVPDDYVEEINANSLQSGKMYILDKEATLKFNNDNKPKEAKAVKKVVSDTNPKPKKAKAKAKKPKKETNPKN